MKTMRRMFWAVPMMAMALFASVSCTSDEVMENPVEQPTEEVERIPNHATMNLQGGLVPFDATTTRAESEEWADGAKVYLQFTVGTALVDGVATYDSETASWTVDYYGELTTGKETKCEAYYFENAGEATHTSITLSEHTAIYADKAAAYMFEDNTLTVIANLTPMTGRIRLAGEISEEYRFSGIKHYCTYSITDNQFVSTEGNYVSSVNTDGFSAYYYGFFPNDAKKELYFDDTQFCMSYVKTLGEQALAVGRSGYLNIPSIDNRSGWETLQSKDITVSNTTFRMIRVVDNGTYNVPSFWIAETEVTQGLWKAVMGSNNNPSYHTGDDNYPVEQVSWDDCQTFITKLNAKTGLNFRLPSGNEWVCASSGACLSQGYGYSGSDSYDKVAWCSYNCSITQIVKKLDPNEIGIYDMSGNVSEWTTREFRSGSTIYHYVYGGNYNFQPGYCNYDDCDYGYSTSSMYGFRLVL